jgi:hypothetical protein
MLFLNIATGGILVLLGMRYLRKRLEANLGTTVSRAPTGSKSVQDKAQ